MNQLLVGTSIKILESQKDYLLKECDKLSDQQQENIKLSWYIRKLIALDMKYKIFQQYYGVVPSTTDILQTTPPVIHDIPKVIQSDTNTPSANGYNLDDLLKECY